MFGLKLLKESDIVNLKEEVSLYKRTLEDIGWINLSTDNFIAKELIAGGFQQMIKRAKIMYVNNPLAKHWVQLTTSFVFGEGLPTPKAAEESVQEVINNFWDDQDNKKTLTSFQAQQFLSNKLQYEGNLFLMLFLDEVGDVRVRVLNTLEIVDIIYDENDRSRVNFYKVLIPNRKYNFNSGTYENLNTKHVFVPDIENERPQEYPIPENNLHTDAYILHVKVNCDINDKFGIPDLYSALDWIKAHKDMAGDMATLIKALSKFAWTRKVKGTAAQVNSIAGALRSKTNLTNISTMSGQTNVENESSSLESMDIKGGGVDIADKGLKQMQLMVSASSGIMYHYFGDPSTGNLATAKSMELPMVKKFVNYQILWKSVYLNILMFSLRKKIELGLLEGSLDYNDKTKRSKLDTALDLTIDLDFPPILEEDLQGAATAFSTAKEKGLIGEELASRLFMSAANVDNIDEQVETVIEENRVKKEEQQAQFQQKQNAFGQQNQGGQGGIKESLNKTTLLAKLSGYKKVLTTHLNKKSKDLEEDGKIETPKKPETRFARKNNFLLQKVNGYRKALSNNFDKLVRDVKENTKVTTNGDVFVGNVIGLERIVERFGIGMKSAAKTYYPLAVQIGEKYVQSHLREKKIKVEETIYEAQGLGGKVLKNRLNWNSKYVDDSLLPDMVKNISDAMKGQYDSEENYKEAINTTMLNFASRVELYVGALWTVEEDAVKEAGKGTGMMVNFAGEDDDHNCEGCDTALAGSPYPIEEAPIPGEQNCLGRCRHALQIVE